MATTQSTPAILLSQNVLHPLLLATNYPDTADRLTSIVIGAMKRLVERDVVWTLDGMHTAKFLWIQVKVWVGTL